MIEKVEIPNGIMLAEVTNMISEGHTVVIPTKGSSMLPFIIGERDSVLLVKPYQVKIGDIVLARLTPERYVLHRIIGIDKGIITLKGDGNLDGTEQCGVHDICAIATQIQKPGKTIDCTTPRFEARSRRWRRQPRFVRRVCLGLYRRFLRLLHRI